MSVIVTLYWTWFAISLAILARRATRRLLGGPRTVTARGTLDAARPAMVATVVDATPLDHAPVTPAAALPAPTAAPAVPTVPAAPAVPTVPAAPAVPTAPAAPAVPTALPRPARSPVAGARVSIADALAGIHLPEDLLPLAHVEGLDVDRRIVFATNGRGADTVRDALVDELRRLGFELEPTGPTDVLARRGDDQLAVHLRTIGPAPKKGPADGAYPTARSGSVVVDLQLR